MLRPYRPIHATGPALVVEPNDARSVESCVTCGARAGTPYCAMCGERRPADRPRTLRALADEIWDAFSPVDGRFARTLWSLVARPGQLTIEFMRGVRAPYVPPLRLFLVVNVLFFLHASLVGNHTFDTPLATHLRETEHAAVATRLVRGKLQRLVAAWTSTARRIPSIAERRAIEDGYARRFNANSTTQAKSLVIVTVPMYALLVIAVDGFRRRLLLHHVVFATHATAFLLLLMIAARYVIGFPLALAFEIGRVHLSDHTQDLTFSAGLAACFALWMRAGLRRAYAAGPIAAVAKAVILAGGLLVVLFAYRALLFFTVFYTT